MSLQYNGRELDADAIRVLEVLQHREADCLTTTEIKRAVGIDDNNRARRRMEWLAEAGLVELGTEDLTDETRLPATTARLTADGQDKAEEWDPTEHRDERKTTEDRIDQLEQQIKDVKNDLDFRIEAVAGDLSSTHWNARGAANRAAANEDSIQDLEERVAHINNRLSALKGHEQRLEKIELFLRDEHQ